MVGLLAIQSLVWVAVKATEDPADLLQAYFVSPTIGEVIPPDTQFDIQAMLSADTDSDFSTVYFNLSNPSQGIDLNYETFLADNSLWQSINYVDTSQLPGGIYHLSATAHVYVNDVLVDSWQSMPQALDIAGGTEIAAEGDVPVNEIILNFIEPVAGEVISDDSIEMLANLNIALSGMNFVLLDGNGTNIKRTSGSLVPGGDIYMWQGIFNVADQPDGNYIVTADLDDFLLGYPDAYVMIDEVPVIIERDTPPPPDVPFEASVILPVEGSTIDGIMDVIVELNQPIEGNQQLVVLFQDSVLEIPISLTLLPITDTRYEGEWDTIAFADGTATISVFVDNDELTSTNFIIDNTTESIITLFNPDAGSTISSDSFQVEFETNFVADEFHVEFFSSDDPAITTGQILIDATNGYNWATTINLDNTFIDGQYNLVAIASGGELDVDIIEDFNLILDLIEDEPPPPPPDEPEDIILELSNPGSNLSGIIDLQATANYPDLDLDFVISNSTDQVEILRLPAVFYEDIYIANLDTTLLDNSNYYLLLSTIFEDTEIISDSVLVTVYNTPAGDDPEPYCGDGEINQDDEECDDGNDQDGDGCSSICILEEDLPDDPEPYCGDGEINQDDEECDDGNDQDGDGCSEICVLEIDEPDDEGNDSNQNDNTNDSDDQSDDYSDDVVIYDLDTSCLEAGILDEANCAHFLSLLDDSIDPICLEQSIYEANACEDYLNIIYVDPQCQEADIIDREQCKDYLLEQYVSRVDCQLDDQNLCNSILRDQYLNRLVVEVNQQQTISGIIEPLLGQHIGLQDLDGQLYDEGIEDILPLESADNIQVLLTDSQEEIVLENQDILTVLNGAVLVIDTDADGLPDDLENYYGTDINNPDTDSDGYNDGTEIKNNYNPAGDGPLDIARTVFDEVILSGAALKQPKLNPINIDNSLAVKEIVNIDDKIRLSGQADKNTWINIYLYSDLPLVMTTKTDANGNWSYTIQKSLQDDHHRVYVTVNSMTGKVVKQSPPTSFLVKSAKAVTADDYFDTTTVTDTTSNMILYYIIAAGLLVLVGLGAIVLLHRRKSGNLEV